LQPTPPRRGFFRRLINAIGRSLTGRQPQAPFEPTPEPTDYGDYIDYREPIEDEGGFWDEPEPSWNPEIDLWDASGTQYIGSHTKEEWIQELLKDKATFESEYGWGNIDVIFALEAIGEWDEEDWRTWRDLYAQVHGV